MSLAPARDLRPANDLPEGAPHNIEAEQALLGCVLYDNAAIERVDEGLAPEHFYEPLHGRMWEAILTFARQGKVADPILLHEKFARDEAYADVGGVAYLADLVDRAPPTANASDYAQAITDLWLRRRVMEIAGAALKAATDGDLDGRGVIEAIEADCYALAEAKRSEGPQTFGHYLAQAVEMAAQAYSRDGGLAGLSTGLIDLDQKIGGLHPSDLIVIAGRPSMGKTSLATNIAFHAAKTYAWEVQPDGSHKTVAGGRVGFFSLEMSGEQLALRILAEVSGVSGDRLRKGEVQAHEFGRVRDAAIEIQEAPLYIDATGGLTIGKLCARARRMKRRHGLDLIVVDYLQLIQVDGRRSDNRVQEVSAITVALKALAKELGVPVIALSQLSRQVENREDKKPQLSDLRESGSIEQDADMVMFVYRESYYLSRLEPREDTIEHAEWREKMDAVRGLADVIIGKQRHGPIGTVKLAFNEDLTKFGNLARGDFSGRRDGPQGAIDFSAPRHSSTESYDG
jgi:replicative DNA helicase